MTIMCIYNTRHVQFVETIFPLVSTHNNLTFTRLLPTSTARPCLKCSIPLSFHQPRRSSTSPNFSSSWLSIHPSATHSLSNSFKSHSSTNFQSLHPPTQSNFTLILVLQHSTASSYPSLGHKKSSPHQTENHIHSPYNNYLPWTSTYKQASMSPQWSNAVQWRI